MTLARLLYVGDVPVESTYHGSALLHRLLENYSPDKLTILETGTPSRVERRIPRVKYLSRPLDQSRWLKTRFHSYAVIWFSYWGSKNSIRIDEVEFDSILTVAHGFGWLAAASLARKRDVPLHLIVHDDWPRAAHVPPAFRAWFERRFASVYKQAQSRLCVSPAMEQAYRERYGESGDVLYPMRAASAPDLDAPPVRLAQNDHQFTVAFAGTINSPGYIRALIALHDALEPLGGRLLIFGPLTREEARANGLDLPNVDVRGLLTSPELMQRLRDEVDVLFVPMSFDAADRSNMEMSFPSKLTDYTAVGLPLLIYGPEYCSAVRWAKENDGVAEVAETENRLGDAVHRLANDAARRVQLGTQALHTGRKYFAHETVQAVFNRALIRG
ncbi:MAG TPA: glycosyltransferase [Pyrinomonadaceae bacterium]|nr:glycosyltransferase [Pyrinomonadaceae bacterium]